MSVEKRTLADPSSVDRETANHLWGTGPSRELTGNFQQERES